MIEAIIFDIGDVLLIFDRKKFNLSKKLGVNFEEFEKLFKDYRKRVLTGKMSLNEFISNIIGPKFNLNEKYVRKIWKEENIKATKLNTELLNIIKNLKKKYKISILSNSSDFNAEIIKESRVLSHFDPKYIFLSYMIGYMKPQRKAFEIVLKELNTKPEETIFVDNRESYMTGAKELGIICIHFKNNKQLIRELRKYKIL